MKRAYGVFVQTPPPSETILIARMPTLREAQEWANRWGGGMIQWQGNEGVAAYGERVYIEEIKLPVKGEKPLRFPKWDEIFETGVFEQFLAPELGFKLTKYGEVVSEDRKKWEKIWKEVERWLMDALSNRSIEAYSLQGREIYPSDVKELMTELRERHRIHEGPREWAPSIHVWERMLAKAFEKLLKVNE